MRADLAVAVGAACAGTVLAATHPPTILGVLLGVPLMLLAPGYALSRALLPGRSVGSVERATAALGLSLATLVLASLAMHAAGVPLSRGSWALMAGGITVIATAIASWRAPWPVLKMRPPRIRGARLLLVLAALALLADAAVIARRPLPPPRGVSGYTQLWLIPSAERAVLGMRSFEFSRTQYRLDLIVDGRRARRWPDIALTTGEEWTTTIGYSGTRMEARLYRVDRPGKPYRHVRIAVPRARGVGS